MKKFFILIPAALLFFTCAFAADTNGSKADSSKECAMCHYEWMPEFLNTLKGTAVADYPTQKQVANEKMCFSCHNGTVADSRIKVWSGDMHKLTNKIPEHMHIPSNLPLDGRGSINCRTCHTAHATGNPHGEKISKSVFLRMNNDNSELCQACHKNVSNGDEKSHPLKAPKDHENGFKKDIIKLGGKFGSKGQVICESCHTPHSPRDSKLLIQTVNNSELCSVCHSDKVDPDTGEYRKGMLTHPINIKEKNNSDMLDIIHSGGKFSKNGEVLCISCHSPHKGKTDTLLIENNQDSSLCLKCHDNKKAVVDSKHDMLTAPGFTTKEGHSAKEVGTCQSCHEPHGWGMNYNDQPGDMMTKACLSCHNDKGIAAKKVLNKNLYNHTVGKEMKKDMQNTANLPLFSRIMNYLSELFRPEDKRTVTCATCHDVHSKNKNALRVDVENGKLCKSCHKEKDMIEKTNHGGQKLDKSCLSCHKVHNAENKRLLIKSENDGCLECHKKGGSAEKALIGEHSHPVNMKAKEKLDEHFALTDDGKFTCVSCHDPHKPSKKGKIDKDFLRGDYSDFDSFCSACHKTQKEVAGTDHDMRKSDKEEVCSQCHSVHSAKTDTDILTVEYNYKDRDDTCKACHNVNGVAKKKVISADGHKLGKVDKPGKYADNLTEKDGSYYLYCSTCHTVHNNGPKKDTEGTVNNSFLNKKFTSTGNVCTACHADQKTMATSPHNVNKFEKNTTEVKNWKANNDTCGACHQVHNGGYYLFDKSYGKDFEKMCKSCHKDLGIASKTAINTSHKMNVKLKNNIDIYLQDGNIVCATCHEPHGPKQGMLRDTGEKNICFACHQDQKLVELSKHNISRLDYLSADDKKAASRNVCYACHAPHNFHEGNKIMWNYKSDGKTPFAFAMCFDCHKVNGVGYKKVPEITAHARIFKIFPYREQYKEYLHDDSGDVSSIGSITCQTCHNPHVWKKGMTSPSPLGDGSKDDSFLKQDTKNDFCAVCHGKEQAQDLFNKFHDKKFRDARELKNKKMLELEVLQNLMRVQQNFQKSQEKK